MKSLIIYFSRAGENYAINNLTQKNTEVVAEEIARHVNADLFECEPVVPYSENYETCCQQAKAYQRANARPALKAYLEDVSQYDAIYIGGPVYWGEYPYEIYSQLDRLDFSGKTIKPFSTHEGSGLGRCVDSLKEKCLGATIKPGLAIRGCRVNEISAKNEIIRWVKE